jgi:hypothetical protein
MINQLSRRDLLKSAALAGAGYLTAPTAESALPDATEVTPKPTESEQIILPLTSTSDVFVPPRGQGFMKFSYDFPEPSVSFAAMHFAFRLYTFENTYALDRAGMSVHEEAGGMAVDCSGLVWAGGQQKAPGTLQARLRKNGEFIEWSAVAQMDQPLKSIAAIIRGVPRGKISAGAGGFFDPKDDEILLGYPFGGGSLFTARGMNSPVAVIQSSDNEFFFLSALNRQVRANRFYFQPGEKGYRAELVYEREGWEKSTRLESPMWRAGRTTSAESAFGPHYQHVERTFQVPDWEKRQDVPAWFRKIALVVSLHGMHWTGYVFNDFARMQKILDWLATRIPAERVLVFIPAWDGRYYWNYPLYKPDPRLGGEDGLRALIRQGQRLGFRFMLMYGANAANARLAMFPQVANARVAQIDGDAFNLNWVDWDNDRHNEGWGVYMNLGVDSWRQWLFECISEGIEGYHLDSYFLDIAGGWENNTQADTHVGTCRLITNLREKHPEVMACGEMSYDALLSCIPVYHVFSEWGYPPAFSKYSRAFQHLSHPAPGRGSSGVHESGFGQFDLGTLGLNDLQIPTITVVDDTFDRHRDVVMAIIERARQRSGA